MRAGERARWAPLLERPNTLACCPLPLPLFMYREIAAARRSCLGPPTFARLDSSRAPPRFVAFCSILHTALPSCPRISLLQASRRLAQCAAASSSKRCYPHLTPQPAWGASSCRAAQVWLPLGRQEGGSGLQRWLVEGNPQGRGQPARDWGLGLRRAGYGVHCFA